MATLFLNCMSHAFDAHSAYMSPTQMENFMSALSSEGYYFGISVDENENGEFVISNLRPGGPAWKSGTVHNGDVIEKLRWAGNEWIDVAGMDEQEIDAILSESNHNTLELTLRNVTAGPQVVQLKKEKLDSDDNIVRSFILEGRKKIGYISLPDFYSEWGDQEGAQCANDVAREILKLKRENIQGLILDVRFNGGGSLAEAVAMAGTFVDAGPMGILKTKATDEVTVKDMNRGTVYDGPLVIMVNRLSASASEFLAAALQDHRRAIIVGTGTYGKATGQEMYSLIPGKPDIDYAKLNNPAWGYSTITTSRIYRINGKSLQRQGVVADITLPDFYDIDGYSEAALPFALKPDSSSKKTYYTQFAPFPIKQLREKSHARVVADTLFASIQNYVNNIYDKKEETDFVEWPLLMQKAFADHHQFQSIKAALENTTPVFSIAVPAQEQQKLLWDEYDEGIHAAWVKNIGKDISLEEAFHILCDYIDTANH
jgi:carboxyl-terminal processing protease